MANSSEKPTPDGSEADSDLIGKELGEFRILRRLGRGGMAEVYLAQQTSLNRKVALKLMRPSLVNETDSTHLQRFEREAKAAAGLTHPNIVQVYSIGEQDGLHYIAQEYVPGVTLKDFVAKKGPPSVLVAVHIMRQVASALQAASEAGIVHRDIKPDNIMITKRGEAKVADFGLAQLTLSGDRGNLTQEGITMGTPLYMSPEQVNGKSLDRRTDIYSLGVTCYYLLTGEPPFRGDTALSIAVQHLNETAAPIRGRRGDVPKLLSDTISRMMAKKPEERFANCEQIGKRLAKVHHDLKADPEGGRISASDFATSGAMETEPETKWERFWAWSGRKDLLAFIGCAFLVACSSAALGWVMRPVDPLSAPVPLQTLNVPIKETAAEQYRLAEALQVDEPAWRAVIDRFPTEPEADRAVTQLAILLMKQRRFGEAEKLFRDLLDGNQRMRANGYAGLATILSYEGDYRESQLIIASELASINERPSPELFSLVERAYQQNQKQLGEQANFEGLFPEEDDPDELAPVEGP